MNKSKRPPPAFQEYASDALANIQFRLATLAERGLIHTMRLECWVNKFIPSNPKEMSAMLNLQQTDLEANLTPRVKAFFQIHDGYYFCKELDDYREMLKDRSTSQSNGGKKGGLKTQENNKSIKANIEATLQANLQAKPKLLSRDESSREEESRVIKEKTFTQEHTEWVNAYDAENSETVNEYLKQSRGH